MELIPKNLQSMWIEEQKVRLWSAQNIAQHEHLHEHLSMIEVFMDCVDMLRKMDNSTTRRFAVTSLFLRGFDNFGAATREALSGNYRNCVMFLRDQLEVHFLLDYLLDSDGRPEEWINSNDEDQYKKYAPKKIREYLDRRDVKSDPSRSGKSNRANWYFELSALGSHAGPRGLELVRDGTRAVRSGPFQNEDSLKQCIEETAKICVLMMPQLILYCYEFGDGGLQISSALAISFQKTTEKYFSV